MINDRRGKCAWLAVKRALVVRKAVEGSFMIYNLTLLFSFYRPESQNGKCSCQFKFSCTIIFLFLHKRDVLKQSIFYLCCSSDGGAGTEPCLLSHWLEARVGPAQCRIRSDTLSVCRHSWSHSVHIGRRCPLTSFVLVSTVSPVTS